MILLNSQVMIEKQRKSHLRQQIAIILHLKIKFVVLADFSGSIKVSIEFSPVARIATP